MTVYKTEAMSVVVKRSAKYRQEFRLEQKEGGGGRGGSVIGFFFCFLLLLFHFILFYFSFYIYMVMYPFLI